jgi:hypothetical protein
MSLLVRMPVVDVEVVEIQSSASKFKPPLGVVFLQSKRVSYKLKDEQIGRRKKHQLLIKAKRQYCSRARDPDPHAFGPPQSGSFPFLIKVLSRVQRF